MFDIVYEPTVHMEALERGVRDSKDAEDVMNVGTIRALSDEMQMLITDMTTKKVSAADAKDESAAASSVPEQQQQQQQQQQQRGKENQAETDPIHSLNNFVKVVGIPPAVVDHHEHELLQAKSRASMKVRTITKIVVFPQTSSEPKHVEALRSTMLRSMRSKVRVGDMKTDYVIVYYDIKSSGETVTAPHLRYMSFRSAQNQNDFGPLPPPRSVRHSTVLQGQSCGRFERIGNGLPSLIH